MTLEKLVKELQQMLKDNPKSADYEVKLETYDTRKGNVEVALDETYILPGKVLLVGNKPFSKN